VQQWNKLMIFPRYYVNKIKYQIHCIVRLKNIVNEINHTSFKTMISYVDIFNIIYPREGQEDISRRRIYNMIIQSEKECT